MPRRGVLNGNEFEKGKWENDIIFLFLEKIAVIEVILTSAKFSLALWQNFKISVHDKYTELFLIPSNNDKNATWLNNETRQNPKSRFKNAAYRLWVHPQTDNANQNNIWA